MYDAVGYLGVAAAVALETIVAPIPSEVILPMAGFLLFSTLGSLPWNLALIFAGFVVGDNYPQIEAAIKPYEYVIYALVIGAILVVGVRWWLGKRRTPIDR